MKATEASTVDMTLVSTVNMTLRGVLSQVKKALDNHEALQRSYFWNDNGNAKARSHRENQLNFVVDVEYEGDAYQYISQVRISRKNFYYKGRFSKNGKKGDVRLFNRLYTTLNQKEGG